MTTWREDLITMALAFWPITAMFFDGRNHNNETGQESFFSIAHLFLYGGLTVARPVDRVVVVRYQFAAGVDVQAPDGRLQGDPGRLRRGDHRPGASWRSAARATSSGTAIYGFEVGVDAIYSPSHLMLFFGGAARELDRHPVDVGEGRHRARPQASSRP